MFFRRPPTAFTDTDSFYIQTNLLKKNGLANLLSDTKTCFPKTLRANIHPICIPKQLNTQTIIKMQFN